MSTQATMSCALQLRKEATFAAGFATLDYVEVSDDQLTLKVFLCGQAPDDLDAGHLVIRGGRRIRDIAVTQLRVHRSDDTNEDDWFEIRVDRAGDHSTYCLCVVEPDADTGARDKPHHAFDPRYACVDFNFKVNCPSDLDCKVVSHCPPEPTTEPDINYIAKDYESFRRLLLDRLALTLPDWCERHVPDLGIALTEVFAYVGDQLSYYQDAVATEAYLQTARLRTSVRRHARLVDYLLHEGCNARAWVCFETNIDVSLDPAEFFFTTNLSQALPNIGSVLSSATLEPLPASAFEPFALLWPDTGELRLRRAHNRIKFYTWGDVQCCIAKGATSATLLDSWREPSHGGEAAAGDETLQNTRQLHLAPGDVLIFEEVVSPTTGLPEDVDPTHRHAVCLTRVEALIDPVFEQPVVEIEWAPADALPFALCLSSVSDAPECELIECVSVACGNVALVDHGQSVDNEPLGPVPEIFIPGNCADPCNPREQSSRPGRYRPTLRHWPLTFSEPMTDKTAAATLQRQDCARAMPVIRILGIPSDSSGDALFEPAALDNPTALVERLRDNDEDELLGLLSAVTRDLLANGTVDVAALHAALRADLHELTQEWQACIDLVASGRDDRHFAVEVSNAGYATIRMGDGDIGAQPEPGMHFFATYRVGGAVAGRVGAETIRHVVYRDAPPSGLTLEVRNPIATQGGVAPESMDKARKCAPHQFRNELRRAITGDDYARLAQRDERVQRAAGCLRFTGSWCEALVAIDPWARSEAGETLLSEIHASLEPFRRIGHDVSVVYAHYVALDVALHVCVDPMYLRGHVKLALLDAFSNRLLPDGTLGFFHADRLSFGIGVYASQLIAAAQALPGVESAKVVTLQRLFEGDNEELELGVLTTGPLEIPRLDNDPDFPENGRFTLTLGGGR